MQRIFIFIFIFQLSLFTQAQDVNVLVQKVRDKINLVNDYEANGKMKTNVSFLKVPVATVKMYFKKPNRLKIKNEKGISFIPKGAASLLLQLYLQPYQYLHPIHCIYRY